MLQLATGSEAQIAELATSAALSGALSAGVCGTTMHFWVTVEAEGVRLV